MFRRPGENVLLTFCSLLPVCDEIRVAALNIEKQIYESQSLLDLELNRGENISNLTAISALFAACHKNQKLCTISLTDILNITYPATS